jgi:SAM-dependent methyltransferase
MPLSPSKLIDRDDFASPALRPLLAEINEQDALRFGAPRGDVVPDARQWQWAMALRALDDAGVAREGHWIAGIGAGTDATTFALARRGAHVVAVDRYLARTPWSAGAPAGMLVDPARHCLLDVPRGHVIAVHSNAVRLNLPPSAFDGVFCCGTLEHLGSFDAVVLAMREIARILKPGGVAVIATEMRVDGPADLEGFHDDVLLLTPALIQRHVVEASGLVLRTPLDLRQSDATFESRSGVSDFIERASTLQCLDEKRAASPGLVLYHEGFLFCPVVLTLHKDGELAARPETSGERDVLARAAADDTTVLRELEANQREARKSERVPESHLLFGDVERLRDEIAMLHEMYDRSNAWKSWRVLRPARYVYRRVKRWRGTAR